MFRACRFVLASVWVVLFAALAQAANHTVTNEGQTFSPRIAHTGRYGDLTGKMVALEPATGFSFDTPMVPRVK